MTEEHCIRMGLNDKVAIGIIRDIWEQFPDINLFMGKYGCPFIDLYLTLDDFKYVKRQYGWAVISWCDMDQVETGKNYVLMVDHD